MNEIKKLINLLLILICIGISGASYAGFRGFDWLTTSNYVEFYIGETVDTVEDLKATKKINCNTTSLCITNSTESSLKSCFIEGDSVDMYDWSSSDLNIVDIEGIDCHQGDCEIEIYDHSLPAHRYIELENDLGVLMVFQEAPCSR